MEAYGYSMYYRIVGRLHVFDFSNCLLSLLLDSGKNVAPGVEDLVINGYLLFNYDIKIISLPLDTFPKAFLS